MVEMPQVDLEKCTGCGKCVNICHCGAIVLMNDKVTIIKTQECSWCTLCEAVCPSGAIRCPFEIIVEG